jgi:Homeodomain-like domain/Integrase core domain
MLWGMALERVPMDKKLLVATLPEPQNWSLWARRLGMSRQSIYQYRARYKLFGVDGLTERSRAPKRPAGRTCDEVEDMIVRIRKELLDDGLDAGPATIGWHLANQGHQLSDSTVWRVLGRRGLVGPDPSKRPKKKWSRYERERANELWHIDDTAYTLATQTVVKIINWIDDRSRVCPESRAVPACTSFEAWVSFETATSRWGIPAEVISDNAQALHTIDGHAACYFHRNMVAAGVRKIRTSPFHPQTNGKVERFHQTQARWLAARPAARAIAELQGLLDEFRTGRSAGAPRHRCSLWSIKQRHRPPVSTIGFSPEAIYVERKLTWVERSSTAISASVSVSSRQTSKC